ncbi:hydrogenase maturation protein HypF [Streptosporangium becharense]|uniref:Carbamoyltransferase n=1 Tax=Streptosporangium becharense TaxID=1816182 RepID=A0A7W9IKK0_9ACTN|nr:carbamoyltransferase HypF [Streptosporangium becharense]MBB2910935.1 hydrogenase maturation protein HypF [Streptosporangium becharense]MBB5822006.1 hydrogenase maturation protein HypF [Streptosporangium becharense]
MGTGQAGAEAPIRVRITIEGIVQGVGFRPCVHSLARRLGLSGWVGNDGRGVFIEAEGVPGDVERFREELRRHAPPLAAVHRMTTVAIPARGDRGFHIVVSREGVGRTTFISPDVATCDDCLAELFDPADRRYRHPFVNCTNCGPRFTIIRDVPYDRPATTMAAFTMCEDCAREYLDPADRRFHAQPICCPACGPTLRLLGSSDGRRTADGDPVAGAARLLRSGAVLAVKGLGGYHLAVDAADEDAARTLRARKHREEKPFAVMVADLDAARALCELDAEAERLLTGPHRPIVLLPRRPGTVVAASVAPGDRRLGLMLPYTPVHHLLAAELARPYVLTSGNLSDEPIVHADADAFDRLAGIADAFLTHDRPIHVRADDSVIAVAGKRVFPIRRSRGYAPEPLRLRPPARRPVLACGAELKSTFCLAREGHAFVSHHIGDLENYETLCSFEEGIEHFRRLFGITPRVVAHDLHPEYLSTKYARELQDVDLTGVQHHHAHIASCLADNQETGPVIGVAYDGLGYGPDGTIWGGELLVADLTGFERAGRLAPVPMPGGTAAVRQPWRMAAAHLDAAYEGAPPEDLAVRIRHGTRWDDVLAVAGAGVNSPPTSSAGRLFDAVASILGLRDTVTYEGQAAIALEQRADPAEETAYPARLLDDGTLVTIRAGDLVRAVAEDTRRGEDPAAVSARFHNGLAAATAAACVRIREATGVGTAALSGGVFQNRLLLGGLLRALRLHGFRVLTHHRVPPNDGGVSLGQAAVAAARDARGLV